MIQMIKYEFKKYVFRKHNIIALLIFTIIFFAAILWGEGRYFSEKQERMPYFKSLGVTFTTETKKRLEAEQSELKSKIYLQDNDGNLSLNQEAVHRKGKYSVTQLSDLSLIASALDCIKVVENRNQNMQVITDSSNSYQTGIFSSTYKLENNNVMVDRLRLKSFASNMFFGWPVCLLLILIFCASFSIEKEKNIQGVLRVTKKESGHYIYQK